MISQNLVCDIKIAIILSCDIIVCFCVRVNLYLDILCFRFLLFIHVNAGSIGMNVLSLSISCICGCNNTDL